MALTLVTCLYDLAKRGADQHRTIGWMLEHGQFVLGLPYHLVIFTEPELVEELRILRADRPTTLISTLSLEELITPERTAAIFRGQIQGNATRAKVTPQYIQLMWAKYGMLEFACDGILELSEHLGPTHVGWIDFAIAHVAKLPPADVDVFSNPPEAPRVHVLRYFDADDTSKPDYQRNVQGHLAGGLVVGGVVQMRQLVSAFWEAADRAIAQCLAPLDEGLLSEAVSRDPDNYSYSHGDYCDILINHDKIQSGKSHLEWQIVDALQRGRAREHITRLKRGAMNDWDLSEIGKESIEPLLGLVMIVKNEAAGIRAVLESFKPYVDRCTILDTGSTDGTQEIVREVLADKHLALHEEPFVDFATSRNRALELHGQCTIFSIMPNGDRLEGAEGLRAFLEAHKTSPTKAYRVRITPGHYYLPLILRTDSGWRYHGRTHEIPMGDGGDLLAPDIRLVRDRSMRTPEQWRQRWERDRALLEEDVARNPADERSWFYLGQTYEGLGDHAKALTAYRTRAGLGGYFDERFEAKLRIGKMLAVINEISWADTQAAYLEAHAFDPRRAEPLFLIAEHYHKRNLHALAYLFASRAAELPLPSTAFFIDEDSYTWKAADLAAVHGFYLDDAAAKANGRRFAEKAVRAKPSDERLRANWAFYAPPAIELFEGYRSKRIGFTAEAPYTETNPSIHLDGGSWRCIIRTVNYKITDGRYTWADGDTAIRTRNFMLDLDCNLNVVRAIEMIDRTGIERSRYPVHGFEDCRLFKHEGKLCFTATVCDFALDQGDIGPREIVLGELDWDSYAIVKATPLRGPWSDRPQKNWMPLDEAPRASAKAVYAISDRQSMVIQLVGNGARFQSGTSFDHGRLRGGSQLVRVPDGWMCIVHDVAFPGNNARIYLHRFVLLDESFQITSMTDPFCFEQRGIEFCAGLVYADRQLVASFGVEDRAAYFGTFDYEAVRDKLRTDYQI